MWQPIFRIDACLATSRILLMTSRRNRRKESWLLDNNFECFFPPKTIILNVFFCTKYVSCVLVIIFFLYWAWGMSSKVSSVYCLTHDKKCMRKALHSPASHQKCATDGPPCVLFSKSLGRKLKITTIFFQ